MKVVSLNKGVLRYLALRFLPKEGTEACSNVSLYIKKQINVLTENN